MTPLLTRRALLLSAAAGAGFAYAGEDDALWREVQGAYTLDRSFINLNNGGCAPAPRVVHEALQRYLDLSNVAPVRYLWSELEGGKEPVRRELAREAGCDPEELAVTRNASEALQIAQLGTPLRRGDEVLTTDQDYPRMLTTWGQRAERDGIVVKKVSFPVPLQSPGPLLDALEAARTKQTRLVHVSHVVFLTGQVLPVAEICAWARARDLRTIVDGAHAFAHVPVDLRAIGCDYYGTSLHKWLGAPVGTGFLYVRRELIPETWPLQPAPPELRADVRKFEEIGTHPAANHNAVAEALVFHRGIGLARKLGRLRALRFAWSDPLRADPRFRFHTPVPEPWSGGIELVGVPGKKPGELVMRLWDEARIIATPIEHAQFQGIRVAPNVYTTFDECRAFRDALSGMA